jgi:hypothetical protein
LLHLLRKVCEHIGNAETFPDPAEWQVQKTARYAHLAAAPVKMAADQVSASIAASAPGSHRQTDCIIQRPDANAETQDLARQVAEAQIDLRRVRYARHKLLSDALANPHYDSGREKIAVLGSLLRKNAPDPPVEDFAALLKSMPQGPHKFATILSQEAKQLLAMDRYERRALSRRKSAIRAFDETRRRPTDFNN